MSLVSSVNHVYLAHLLVPANYISFKIGHSCCSAQIMQLPKPLRSLRDSSRVEGRYHVYVQG